MKRSLLLTLLLLISAGLVSPAGAAERADTVRIGVYLPLTGPMAARGQAEYAGITVAHKMKPAVLGTDVELFTVDSAAEDRGTAGAATRLIREHRVHALIGEPLGEDPLGGISLAEEARKPTVIPSLQPPAIRGKRYAFSIGLTDTLEGAAAARYAFSRLKITKAAVLMDIERDSSITLANIFTRAFTEAGGTIVAAAYCRTGDSDFTTQLSSIMAAKADVLYLPVPSPEVARICRQSVEMGINIHMIAPSGAHTPGLITAGGEPVNGIIVTSDFGIGDDPSDIVAAYANTFEKETGTPAGRFDALGADAYFLLLDAIERGRSTAGSKLRRSLARTEGFRGISGIMDMDRGGSAVKDVAILQIQGAAFRYLETLPLGKKAER